jgi:hypothetical protein
MSADRWEDARRLEAFAGEARVNLVRTAALAAFYGHHLLRVAFFDPSLRGSAYSAAVTIVVAAWAAAALALHLCLRRRFVPPALPYVATSWDLALITALLVASPDGPHSPLVLLYFLVVAASSLRLLLPLVLFTTLAAWAAAAVQLGHYVFIRVGAATYYDAEAGRPFRVDRAAEVIFVLALGGVGLLAGQAVRQARRLVAGHPVTVQDEGPTEQG